MTELIICNDMEKVRLVSRASENQKECPRGAEGPAGTTTSKDKLSGTLCDSTNFISLRWEQMSPLEPEKVELEHGGGEEYGRTGEPAYRGKQRCQQPAVWAQAGRGRS